MVAPGFSTFTITAQDNAVQPNVATIFRHVLRYSPSSISFADGLPDKWKIDHGLDPFSNTGINGPNGDPDKDGIVNLLERAMNLDPRKSDNWQLPSIAIEINGVDGLPYLIVTHRRLIDSTGLIYSFELSPDLQAWTAAGVGGIEEVASTPTGDGVSTNVSLRVKPSVNTPGMNARFIRLRVSAQ